MLTRKTKFATLIKKQRLAKKLSFTKCAKKAGIGRATLLRIEHGHGMEAISFVKLCRFFKLDIAKMSKLILKEYRG